MKKLILIILMTVLAGCSGLTVKATYQYPAPAAK
jgi:uncharacterized lipoprotein YmbA